MPQMMLVLSHSSLVFMVKKGFLCEYKVRENTEYGSMESYVVYSTCCTSSTVNNERWFKLTVIIVFAFFFNIVGSRIYSRFIYEIKIWSNVLKRKISFLCR